MDRSKKRIAITFDDGPSPNTEGLCDLFSEYSAGATFFFVGESIDESCRAAKCILDSGCELGNHTFSHRPMSYMTDEEIKDELLHTKELIRKSAADDDLKIPLARAPYGDLNDHAKDLGGDLGFSFIGWSLDTRDWDQKSRTEIYDAIINRAKDGDIILCHETQEETLEAMRAAVPRLRELGFELLTVSELLDPKGLGLTPGKLYCRAEEAQNEN